jgi:pimeloyl-ACP methyl ester carboxylesterase
VPEKYVQVEGIATFVRHVGPTTLPEKPPDLSRGETVVCMHGAGGNSGLFTDVLERLGKTHSPIAFDFPGHARSESDRAHGAPSHSPGGYPRNRRSPPANARGVESAEVFAAMGCIAAPARSTELEGIVTLAGANWFAADLKSPQHSRGPEEHLSTERPRLSPRIATGLQ